MKQFFSIMNHSLSNDQIPALFSELGAQAGWQLADEPELARRWANIDPAVDLDNQLLEDIQSWLLSSKRHDPAQPGDVIIIAGEPVHSFALVSWCIKQGFVPVAATTRRESVEKTLPDGSVTKTNIFRHVKWRKYVI